VTEAIHQHSSIVRGPADAFYSPRIMGEKRIDGTWAGWIEFEPAAPGLPFLATDRETTQPSRAALLYWATGLEPIFLAGALQRALLRQRLRPS